MSDPLDKIQTDPRPMPEFDGEMILKGSPEGKISLSSQTEVLVFCRWSGLVMAPSRTS